MFGFNRRRKERMLREAERKRQEQPILIFRYNDKYLDIDITYDPKEDHCFCKASIQQTTSTSINRWNHTMVEKHDYITALLNVYIDQELSFDLSVLELVPLLKIKFHELNNGVKPQGTIS